MAGAEFGVRHHRSVQSTAPSSTRLWVALSLGVACVATAFVPASSSSGQLRWLGLVLATPLVAWCALPVHLRAVGGVARGRLTSDLIGSVGIWVSFAWLVHAVVVDRVDLQAVPVALTTTVLVIAAYGAARSGVADDSAPVWLVAVLLLVAVASLVVWWMVDGSGAGASAALSVLLGSGPAALLLAEPAALIVGARRGSALGMTVSDPSVLSAVHRIDTIVFDKDRTVTTGELSVISVETFDPDHDRNVKWFAGALEHHSDHPVGRAIAKLSGRGRVTNVVEAPGLGISGSVDRHPVRVGEPDWIGLLADPGLGTVVGVEVDGKVLGQLTVADTLRPDASDGVTGLRRLGLDPILVSDGPSLDTDDLAQRTGITTCHAESSVADRVALVRRLQAEGRVVAVAGSEDGNAAALEAADLAISGGAGSGVGLADLGVMNVGAAITLCRSILTTSRDNRRVAVAGMLAPIPFAAAGLIPPVFAALVPVACAAAVVVNSLRIPRADGSASPE